MKYIKKKYKIQEEKIIESIHSINYHCIYEEKEYIVKQVKDNDSEIALAIACAIRERGRA